VEKSKRHRLEKQVKLGGENASKKCKIKKGGGEAKSGGVISVPGVLTTAVVG